MKHIMLFEQFIKEASGKKESRQVNEAARVGRSNWKAVQKELSRMGWDLNGEWAEKPFGDEELLRITASGDEVSYEVLDYRDNVTNSGSFDGEGLSAGELDSEVWNYVDGDDWSNI